MDERLYENLITRYAPSWNAPPQAAAAPGLVAALPPSMPTGKPTNAEFPSAASTPPVNIMTPEPTSAAGDPGSACRRRSGRDRAAAGRGSPNHRRSHTDRSSVAGAGGSQETAAGAETRAGRAGPAVAGTGCAGSTDGVIHSRGARQRMIVFKRRAAR